MGNSTTAQINELEKRQEQLSARIQMIQAREKDQRRKRDARRKIIIGAGVITLAGEHPGFRVWLIAALKNKTASRDWLLVEEAFEEKMEEE